MEILKTFPAVVREFAPRRGIRDMVEAYFVEHYPDLFRYLVFSGSAASDAEDILQEAFLRLYSEMLKGNAPNNLKNWLYRVAFNVRVDRVRSGASERLWSDMEWLSCGEQLADASGSAELALLQTEKSMRMKAAMACLTERQAQYLLLRAEGLTYREIAQMHGVAIGTVAESCGRAMEKLSRWIRG